MGDAILPLLEELRLIARNGLLFADDPYDEERYERLLELVEHYYGASLGLPDGEVRDRLRASFGYVLSAAVGIFDAEGQVLLMKRTDNEKWALPGGLVEPHENPPEAAIRETKEETGLDVRLLGQVTANYLAPTEADNAHQLVHFIYLGEVTGGSLQLSEEGQALEYRHIDDVPAWHPHHFDYASSARDTWTETVE